MRGFFGADEIGALINKKKYAKAQRLLREQLARRPQDVHLRQRLADVLELGADEDGAITILDDLAAEFADDGFDTKAIAVLKKMQRIDPERTLVEEKLARLVRRRHRKKSGPPAGGDAEAPAGVSGVNDRLPAVQRSPLFASLSDDELLAVVGGLALRTFEPGEIIFSERQPGDSLFVVANGAVRVYVCDADGRNRAVRILEEGAFFGEISLLSGKPRSATIIAAAPTELLELDCETLYGIALQHPQVPATLREVYYRRTMSPEEVAARGESDSLI